MNIKNREQLLAIFAISAVALLAGDKFILTPLTQAWKARAVQIAELKKSVTSGSKLLEREKAVRDHWQGMRTNTLPNEISVAERLVIGGFDRWSRDSGVSISAIKPQWKRVSDDYSTLECRADASGSLTSLARFIYQVEKDPLAIKVEGVDISTRDNTGQQLTLNLTVSGLVLTPKNREPNTN